MSLFSQSGVQLSGIEKLSNASIEATFAAALELLDSQGWQATKTYNESEGMKVECSKLPARQGEKLMWHMRRSEHPVGRVLSYDEFRNGLLLNHTPQEQNYVPDLKHSERVKVLHEGLAEVWLMQYKTPPVTSNREFAELILTKDLPENPTGRRSFLIVQVPVLDVPTGKGHERGKYLSVEQVTESEDSLISWRMATASSAGGSLPQRATDMAMPSQIAHDVPNFIKWAQKKRA